MTQSEPRQENERQDLGMDRKAAFDAGYDSYEGGNSECDFGPDSKTSITDPIFASTWRFGWRRAREDYALSNRGLLFE